MATDDSDFLAWLAKNYATEQDIEKYGAALREKARRERYLADPVLWGQERLGEFYWSKQRDILRSVAVNRRTAVKSCHQVGKSMSAARVACWWLENHPVGESFVVTSAPTGPQVKAILWREIGKAHKKGNLIGRTNTTEWYIGDEMVAFGRKPNDYEPTAFQGIHARYVLIILDEACGIPQELWDAASTLVTNADSRILAIGNPDDSQSYFAKVCEPESGWNVIRIDAFDSPNFTGEEVPDYLRHVLITPEWVEEKAKEWGEDSGLYTSKVRGDFPRDDEDGVVLFSWLTACQREVELDATDEVTLGVDVGAGGDRSVITEKRGPVFGRQWESKHDDPERLTGEIVRAAMEVNPKRINVDGTGVGWGVAGHVRSVLRDKGLADVEVNAVMVGEKAHDTEHYVNLKAQQWWDTREAIRRKEWDIRSLDGKTISELSKPRYKTDSRGRIQIESKDDLRKRLGYSPDKADSVVLAAYVPPTIKRKQVLFLGTV